MHQHINNSASFVFVCRSPGFMPERHKYEETFKLRVSPLVAQMDENKVNVAIVSYHKTK